MELKILRYLEVKGKKPTLLISYHNHDYKSLENELGKWMIDGGQSGYIRFSTPDGSIPKVAHIKDLLPFLRKDFKWTSSYDKNGKRLSKSICKKLGNITTEHIVNIISHIKTWKTDSEVYLAIFKAELETRTKTHTKELCNIKK